MISLWLLWLLAPIFVGAWFVPGMIASAVSLHRTRALDFHFVSARALFPPTSPQRPVRPVGVIAQPTAQSPRIVASERVVLATGYLRAVAAGDRHTKREMLSVLSSSDLVAGLTVVTRMLADEFSDATGQSTDAVLEALHERAITRHREIVVLA